MSRVRGEAAYMRRVEQEAGPAPEPRPCLFTVEIVEWWSTFVLRAFGHADD